MGAWYWWTIFGMALVTYIPRVFPLTFLEGKKLPPVISGVLSNIPFAVLGALIFPAILYVQQGNLLFGVIGAVVAFTLAIISTNVMVVVLGTIGVLAVYSLLF
ncbi:AzlD domain-containing protein [Psychrobacillus glaciei]|uniref:AzlD domain-containing protein n=1 Tax=Psychrobacillus glaciei TaxID=2283160 RepID=A0A5J6SJZ4_9BACI|nr:AzlD domain-containing protein [Psychrobacillus glaciei]QFF98220.1 AzlD domain-containing protein [Psychrobacillus glaciei]